MLVKSIHSFLMEISGSIEIIISAGIAIFSVLLLVLSVSGYRKTRIRLVVYAVIILACLLYNNFWISPTIYFMHWIMILPI